MAGGSLKPISLTFRNTEQPTEEVKQEMEGEIPVPVESGEGPEPSPVLHRSARTTKGIPPMWFDPSSVSICAAAGREPQSYEQVMQLPQEEKLLWLTAIQKEYNALCEKHCVSGRACATARRKKGHRVQMGI